MGDGSFHRRFVCPFLHRGPEKPANDRGSIQDQLKTVTIHLCSGCETKIVTKGHGKSAKDVVVHKCKACGSKDVSCCVMKKGSHPTSGMDGKK